ncbi:MAG: DUF1501 domain-containing protein [Verrucomicrobia bacterium]|nr:DUF1501 domain-containing protein [Verrucomicrobiota bacterium]
MKSPSYCSRRHFLRANAFGLSSVALAWLLREDGLLAAPVKPHTGPLKFDLAPKSPPNPARARAMISLFMMGGPSHVDLLDTKPSMAKYDGQKFPGDIKYDNVGEASSKVFASPFKFQKHGQCGTEVSELLPHLASIVDDISVIRSMKTGVNNHRESLFAVNTGNFRAGRPALGSWLSYGLGAEAQNLPAYMALTDPRGLPQFAGDHWSSGWLPAIYQGTQVRATEPRILNLDPADYLRGAAQERQLAFLQQANREHLSQHPGDLDLDARIASYELAARMQTSAKDALDISSESEATKKLYGIDKEETRDYGTRCLIARRLVERGVRFVHIINVGQSWDHHGSLVTALPKSCIAVDQPCAALIKDLKSRGLFDSTIVHWGGEMGRLPVVQNDGGKEKAGRDHNTYGFTMWLAGGGIKRGYVHGATDEWGHHAVKDVVHHYDYLATVLNLFGLEHQKLTYKRNGMELSLTDNPEARVVRELIG